MHKMNMGIMLAGITQRKMYITSVIILSRKIIK